MIRLPPISTLTYPLFPATTRFPSLIKHLLAKNTSLPQGVSPVIHEYQTPLHEFAGVTRQVRQLMDQGVPPAEIAVIYKQHAIGEELMGYFRLAKIPVSARKKLNVLKTPFGQQLLTILRYLRSEEHTSELQSLMRISYAV